MRLPELIAGLLLVLAPAHADAFNLYVGDALGNPVKPCVPIYDGTGPQPTVTHHLWFDAGSGVAAAPCNGVSDSASTTVCFYDVTLNVGPGITIEGISNPAPGLVRTPDPDLGAGVLSFNAGDPEFGQNFNHRIMTLDLSATAADSVTLVGEMWVTTELLGNNIASAQVFYSGLDRDQDGDCDDRDPCPDWVNDYVVDRDSNGTPDMLQDNDGDGIPLFCTCADADNNGLVTSTDLISINLCVQDNTLCDQSLIDANGDGATTSTDIIAANTVVNGAPQHSICCERRPRKCPANTDTITNDCGSNPEICGG